ncbi:phage protein, HK97 gp10 family [Devosia lucknowensis]|uniref:Phage protein, HK97 gp10 family n=1 Tax=Devosia lucknowensis TaxID=1096929 RepID=A0A1Y6ET29_9HYPH|nr:HK97-gp10 family putative phage morphogenesis protein [Devosia lucknowensis]SMQ65874.1 phage protein, HK97 gp10 family [Devosia lucknowensis]
MAGKIQGLDRLKKKLRRMPEQAKVEIKKALNLSADEMVDMAKGLAPFEDGALKNSIQKEGGRHELAIDVVAGGTATTREVRDGAGVEYDYALAQEFGTSNMKPTPFFFPAYRVVRKRIKSRVSRATTKAAKTAASGG